LRLLALEADAADPGQTEERLPNRVRVPRSTVRAPGVNVTTEPPRRDGASAVITGSWNTTPVKVSAAPRLVVSHPRATPPAATRFVADSALEEAVMSELVKFPVFSLASAGHPRPNAAVIRAA
jgi:hypothetical protein